MIRALTRGLRAAWRARALVIALWLVNVATASLLAIPFGTLLERELHEKESAATMARGFDYAWWSRWSEAQQGWTAAFKPDILGSGFAFRNTELLLKGALPANLLAPGAEPSSDAGAPDVDGVVLGLGAFYLLVQVFFAAGIVATLRDPRGTFTVRAFGHGSSFYFGRMLRIAIVALAADALLFRLGAPFAGFMAAHARESVSESAALAWSYARYAGFLAGLLGVHLLAGYARVFTVLEERKSALLAYVSALGFCFRHAARALGHYALVAALAGLSLGLWAVLDSAFAVTGWGTQLLAFVLMQTFVAARIGLRVALVGGQVELYRSSDPTR